MSTKKVIAFYLEGCPYCRQARKALSELEASKPEYSSVNFEWVEENQHPEISAQYDYYHVPAMFVEGLKVYEAHPGEKYEECRENVRRVLEEAVAGH
ncbi:MAG: thioredoxin family protein [Synergistaceae bacterium]|nr:thioredoxin family protein [Synergistaceae bacterium]